MYQVVPPQAGEEPSNHTGAGSRAPPAEHEVPKPDKSWSRSVTSVAPSPSTSPSPFAPNAASRRSRSETSTSESELRSAQAVCACAGAARRASAASVRVPAHICVKNEGLSVSSWLGRRTRG